MNTNTIRNYNEITNNGIIPSTKYIEKVISIKKEEDKDACLRFLTINNTILSLCHGYYSPEYINTIIECGDTLIYFHTKDNPNNILAFSLFQSKSKKKGKLLNILLVCAIPNKLKFGRMIAYSLYNFAIKNKYPFLYCSPRTPELRKTFIHYGFESIHGIEGIDEVLEKEIEMNIPKFNSTTKTLKVKRSNSSSNQTNSLQQAPSKRQEISP